MTLYINNFKGQAGRTERSKHLRDEFQAIEDAFANLQALNIASYLTIYINTTSLGGEVTISPDNGYLQELTITQDTAIGMSTPSDESHYRVSLLIHGSKFKITNLWGAQTWKEYGIVNWWELYTGEGPFASMLIDFFWDICSNTWIGIVSSKNQFNLLPGGTAQRHYPLTSTLTNVEADDTLGFTRASPGMAFDNWHAHYFAATGVPRYFGPRYVENWVASSSDLSAAGWEDTNCTVTTDAAAGPDSEDVNRLTFTAVDGECACWMLPAFGRASKTADTIKFVVSFQAQSVAATGSMRVITSFMGKTGLATPVHDAVTINVTSTWKAYGYVFDIAKTGNDQDVMNLAADNVRTLVKTAFVAPSGSVGAGIRVTNVQIEILRDGQATTPSELQDSTIGASMALSASGTGAWDDGTKVLTFSGSGQSMDFSANLEIGKTYLCSLTLNSGTAVDVRMQDEQVFWEAGDELEDQYEADAPFVFRYDGGVLKFVQTLGQFSNYTVHIYECSNNRGVYSVENTSVINDTTFVLTRSVGQGLTSHYMEGVSREVAATNQYTFSQCRTFSTAWTATGLGGESNNSCKNPVFRGEYGIEMLPTRGTLVQGASKIADGNLSLAVTVAKDSNVRTFSFYVRRSVDSEGNQIVTPQHDDVTVPVSEFVDVLADLSGGSTITGNRVRVDLKDGSFQPADHGYTNFTVTTYQSWYRITLSLTNNGLHDTFTARIWPASGAVAGPTTIDYEQTGWIIIDWAQLELDTGSELGSSPILGGETRVIEDFTSGLSDGDFYNAANAEHVATLSGGVITWDVADGRYKNLLYSTELMEALVVARNMHEFGLVAGGEDTPPNPTEVLATSNIYPIEVVEGLDMDFVLTDALQITRDLGELDMGLALQSGSLRQLLRSYDEYEPEELDIDLVLLDGTLRVVFKSTDMGDEGLDMDFILTDGVLRDALVQNAMLPEGLDMGLTLQNGSLT
jgi:hypothetical protein